MVSLKTTGFAVATALAAIAQADYIIDPKTVPKSTRGIITTPDEAIFISQLTVPTATWCQDEKRTCPLICQQTEPRTTLINECDPVRESLTSLLTLTIPEVSLPPRSCILT
jgi:hypothetical protein